MSYAVALGGALIFAALIQWLRLPSLVRQSMAETSQGLDTFRDPSLSDDQKEEALRRQGLRAFRSLGGLLAGLAAAVGIPVVMVLILDWLGVAPTGEVLAVLTDPILLGIGLIGTAAYLFFARRKAS